VQTVGPGELLGLSWLAERAHWQWDARAAVDTSLVEFSVVGLRRLWASDHELERILMERIAATLAERLHAARLQLADLYGDNW
jgi:CRP-like cAMP-binding protein